MAKITITIEDLPGNKVSVKAEPTLETMFKMELAGDSLTSAQGYAFTALRAIREESKKQTPTKIIIPRVTGL